MWRLLTTDASEAFHKLRALLTFVCNDFQRGPKLLVVIGEPLKQWHALDQLMLLTCLKQTYTVLLALYITHWL